RDRHRAGEVSEAGPVRGEEEDAGRIGQRRRLGAGSYDGAPRETVARVRRARSAIFGAFFPHTGNNAPPQPFRPPTPTANPSTATRGVHEGRRRVVPLPGERVEGASVASLHPAHAERRESLSPASAVG